MCCFIDGAEGILKCGLLAGGVGGPLVFGFTGGVGGPLEVGFAGGSGGPVERVFFGGTGRSFTAAGVIWGRTGEG